MSELTWSSILERADHPAALAELLLAAGEPARLAFGPTLTARLRAMRPDDFWGPVHLGPAVALTAIACLPTAAKVATVLGRADVLDWPGVPAVPFVDIARARQLPWLGDLGLRLARRIGPAGPLVPEWRLVAELLRESGTPPPVTVGVVRGWLRHLHRRRDASPPALAGHLRDDPWLDILLPAVFDLDGVGRELAPAFAPAVAQLVAEQRLDRATILAATVDRLARGDRPAFLRAFVLLHDELRPSAEEAAGHAADYARMLSDGPSAVAGLAQRVLREVDAAGLLDRPVLLAASAEVLVRPAKALALAQLAWLRKVAAREPADADAIAAAMAAGFGHPALDVQDRALQGIGDLAPRLAGPTRSAILAAAGALPGGLPARAAALLGSGPGETAVPDRLAPTPRPAEPTPMPPPIASPAELVEEIMALLHEETAVGWERVLAAVVTFGATIDREALAPVLPRLPGGFGWSRMIFLAEAIRAILDGAEAPMAARVRWAALYDGTDDSLLHNPDDLLKLRIAEAAERWSATPVPVLLATPSRVDGSLDAAVLADRLERAEAEGWEPWPLDYEQALLRVVIDRSVLPRAGRLTSSRGRQFAAWLATGGLPDPVSVRFEQRGLAVHRVVASLDPARADGPGLVLEGALTRLSPSPRPQWGSSGDYSNDVLVMAMPHHREVTAAWALPDLAALADQDARDASLLPMLAEAGGPVGPAMALAVVYGLAARFDVDRVAAVDAFLTLAGRPEPFAAAVGAELGALGRDNVIKLLRVAPALADAERAGASHAVWAVLATALPILLPAAPRGLADLLEVATRAATAVGARAELPGLAAVADRTGGARVIREARRLRDVLRSR
ncbi:DUF6493 family protein [Actinoplanes sp. L3-i22]|uniref:DUF6493 family protein n=1 Tax=Actinoplanes sp. L3-i22 TaxID=2836373 RepID=UPI001C74D5F9|nr:DUF6493 family protein [Actinoplanes sp. L3-i22]BCY12577.1 hypothetical protein L3i22_076650 [Actinoplanes sp. L3-i22]